MPEPSLETFLTSCGLNSLCQKGYHILGKNWIFDDLFHKTLPLLVILVPVMIRPSGSGSFLEEIGLQRLLRPVRLQRPLRSMRLERFLRPGKSLLWTSESSRFLNSIILGLILLYFEVLKKSFFDRIMKTHVEFQYLFCLGLLRPHEVKKVSNG